MPSAQQRRELRSNRLDFFATPPDYADRLANAAFIHALPPGARVVDPTCGHGALLLAARRVRGADDLQLIGVELDPTRCQATRAAGIVEVYHRDILDLEAPDEPYDVILANPPFNIAKRFDGATGAERRHPDAALDIIERVFPWLAPDGTLASILPAGWNDYERRADQRRTGTPLSKREQRHEAFYQFVEEHGYFEELPAGVFKDAGTNVATTMIVLSSTADQRAPYRGWPSFHAFNAWRYLQAPAPAGTIPPGTPLRICLDMCLARYGMSPLLDRLTPADWRALEAAEAAPDAKAAA